MVIGPKFTVSAYSKISMMSQPTEEDSSDEELEYADAASGRAESPRSPFLGIFTSICWPSGFLVVLRK